MEQQKKRRKTVGLKQKERSQWCMGRLCPIINEKSIFIKPLDALPEGYNNKDVFMHPDNISKYVLPLKGWDSVEFVLGDRDKAKPMARKVRVSQYSQRTCEDLVAYITKYTEDLNSEDCKIVLMETLSNTVMWSFLGSPVFDKRGGDPAIVRYVEALLPLLKLILRLGKAYKTLVEEMIKTVVQGMLFKESNKESLPVMIKSSRYVANRDVFYFTDTQTLLPAELIRSFCRDVVGQVPPVSRCLLSTVSAVNEMIPSPATQSFLFEFISLALSGESTMIGDEGVWQELPFVPTDRELAGHLVEKDSHLSPVKNSYLDAESYMDTYYRLLRAETFSAIQHGIKKLKACELDERDMNVYHNIHLAGFDIQNGRFSLAVHFTPARAVKKWEASPQLMFGNLVCISLNRKFDDVIWATVSNRDPDLLNKHQVIMLELIDENTMKMSEIISSLQAHAGSGVMVESPTYYHAFNPVLRSLKAFDIENFPLQKEVVDSRPTPQLPNYLQQANTVNTSPIYKDDSRRYRDWETSGNDIINGEMEFKRFLEIFNVYSSTCLEASQCEALKQALINRLAIIQGPPGCGKTFIGVKIVQLLLSLSPKLEKPILLLTYKNHALDEFLKHMLKFSKKDDLVRIGGRSKEPELESCNLQSVIREMMKNKSYGKAMFAEIQETRNEIEEVEARIKELSSKVDASSHLTQSSFISELSEEQLRSLLVEAAWGKPPLVHRVNNRTFADKALIETLVDNIAKNFGSLSAFLLSYLSKAVAQIDQDVANCFNLFNKSFQAWFPDRQDLRHMKEFQAEFVLQIRSEKTERGSASNAPDNGDDQDSGDEEHVKELLEKRMASTFKQGERSKDGLVLFKSVKNNNKDVLIEISDYPGDMQVGPQIRSVVNLWNLNKVERLQFLYCILNEKTSKTSEEFDQLIEKLDILKSRKDELEMNKKVELLSQKKIIGVTITGASINHDLIHHIGPSVVIVEEAAEILEPSLLAALTSSIEHLILIGDHKQLRPQVDTYDLCRNFHFDKSMMERLIDAKFPFKSLTKQNRMRPEFSALLHDIYPNLEDNLSVVSKNEPLKCIGKSMFFWTHDYPEKHDRTYTNVKEAERIIALVLYLLWSGCRPSEITVLAAYLGQTKLLRNMLKQSKAKHPELFQEALAHHDDDNDNGTREGFVQVQTIDMYQGDENKYVLISLVRSNDNNKIGFLNQMNRRCVAQSRAMCGMYFVGNLNVLREARESRWYRMINSMIGQECAGYTIPLQCNKHTTSRYDAVEGDEIHAIIATPKRLCQRSCGDPYPCGVHCCKRSCLPRHHHGVCVEIVEDVFPDCRHSVKRKCAQDISQLLCKKEVRVVLRCMHETKKQCHQRACDILCDELVPATFPKCGHKTEKKCYVKIENMSCSHPCEKMNSCGIHRCVSECGKPHGHDSCQKKIDYQFPSCKHPSSKKKRCSEAITWPCTYTVYFSGSCGHRIEKKCYENCAEIKCPVKPCGKLRQCGHPCTNACGDDCEKGDCKRCQDIHKEKMKKFHEAAKKKMKDLEDKIGQKAVPTFSIDEILSTGPTAAEYQMANDLVVKFIQPMHNWFPKVTKIEKVTNLVLEKKFEEAKSKAFGDHIDSKFHGTSNDGVKGITNDGFRMPDPSPPPDKRGMYGQGIYFATDSSKSARTIYTKGSQKLLLCQVILGRSKTVRRADYTLNKQKLRSHGYDSVFAPRGTAVMNDEFVIFDPDQALPQYIIHFSDTNTVVPPSPSTLATQPITVTKMLPSRAVNFQDPFEMYYNFAESHFRRMAAKSNPPLSQQQATITSIDIVINKNLEKKFEATRRLFQNKGIPDREILAYHGTPSTNIPNILQNNLTVSYARRQAYGRGNYFSEYPAVSLGYGDGLLLCRILPGKEYVDSGRGDIPQGYDSKKVLLSGQPAGASAAAASGEMIIIENSDQILPFFVIHR